MEFLDINLIKDMLFTVPSIGVLYSVLIIHTNKQRNKKTRVYSWIAFCRNGEKRIENQTKTRVWEYSSLCPETSTKTAQEFHLWSMRKRVKATSARVMTMYIECVSVRTCDKVWRQALYVWSPLPVSPADPFPVLSCEHWWHAHKIADPFRA